MLHQFFQLHKKGNLKDKQEITCGISNGVCLHSAFILRGLFLLMGKEKANKTAKKRNESLNFSFQEADSDQICSNSNIP